MSNPYPDLDLYDDFEGPAPAPSFDDPVAIWEEMARQPDASPETKQFLERIRKARERGAN